MLPLNLSDTAATSQDGSSLEFIAAFAGRQCYIQDARSRGLWLVEGLLSTRPTQSSFIVVTLHFGSSYNIFSALPVKCCTFLQNHLVWW